MFILAYITLKLQFDIKPWHIVRNFELTFQEWAVEHLVSQEQVLWKKRWLELQLNHKCLQEILHMENKLINRFIEKTLST
jgi:hypothetical protein